MEIKGKRINVLLSFVESVNGVALFLLATPKLELVPVAILESVIQERPNKELNPVSSLTHY
jgi:hypothetical protein